MICLSIVARKDSPKLLITALGRDGSKDAIFLKLLLRISDGIILLNNKLKSITYERRSFAILCPESITFLIDFQKLERKLIADELWH